MFQPVGQERWSVNLHRTRLFLFDLQYFAYQESVHGFLLLSNEKTVGIETKLNECAFLHQESQTAEKRGSLRVYAH
ncbi:hypothetical protein, partial [Bacteroides clarus]|uniref:hypothetical protein n=1 Tax=Bacteroides clarus TaxID=626929 RepID=UPI00266CD6FC